MRRVILAGVCLWVVGCGFHRNRATSDETVAVQPSGIEDASGDAPLAIDDPPVENPVREVTDDLESQRPTASDPQPDAVFVDPSDALIEGLFSAWMDERIIDLLFPDNGFRRGPEFLDGGPNTLFWICVDGGTPEFICRQRYGP